jgi:hypothetical protein
VSVRTWFTLSALAMLALAAAFVYRFLIAPLSPPEILVRVDDVRLEGVQTSACWPQRGSELRCDDAEPSAPAATDIPRSGTLRLVAAFPEQPLEGTVVIAADRGPTVLEEEWARDVPYALEPGTYLMTAEARYPADAFVRYLYRLRVG